MSRRPRAFTLVEVLVSLAIFALAAVVLATAYVNVLTGYQRVRGAPEEASDLAFVRATILAEPRRPAVERGGELRQSGGTVLRWRATVEPAGRADLFRVTLDCELAPPDRAADGRHERDTFLVLRPTWSDPVEREKLRAKFREQLARRKT